jgi:hypothetical protein
VAPPGAEVTKANADDTSSITDAEAMAALGKTQVATKPEPAAKADPAAKMEAAAKKDDSGEVATGRRKPPTLLEPGENVEKVKPPAQQQQSQK